MGISRGKDFEVEMKKAFSKHSNISLDRFPDPMAGYAGIRNICDFGVYRYPFQYYFECKAFSGNTLNFKAGITKDQWDGMIEKSQIPGVVAGVIIWFIDHNITALVPIQELVQLRNDGAKSLNAKDIIESKVIYFTVPGRKKRVFFEYDADSFMDTVNNWAMDYWEEVTSSGKG